MTKIRRQTPQSAYIHIPFCEHRCAYCNFTLIANRQDLVPAFLDAIDRELQMLGQAMPIQTLFLGGGTPTYLSESQLNQLFDSLDRWLPRQPHHETSVEANPNDISPAILQLLTDRGVNRLSLGIQSFDNAKLRALDRFHTADQSLASVQLAREWLNNVSVDLIFAAPGETQSTWQRDLDTATELGVQHISTYGLTFERGTRFWSDLQKQRIHRSEEDAELSMYRAAISTLASAGFDHYEVSNFATPDHRCRHNEVYWQGRTYFAFGPGAARFVHGRRETNHRSTTTYLKRMQQGLSPTAESETLADEDYARERLVFGLRRLEGIRFDDFQRDTGYSLESIGGAALRRYLQSGWLEILHDTVRLTRQGLFISDALWPDLLVADNPNECAY